MSNGFFTVDPFPLTWPEGWPRTKSPQWSRFDTTLGRARDEMLNELRLMGARHVVISSNLPLRRDGMPAAVKTRIVDAGVAVYFERDGQGLCIPCDKWSLIEDNIRAVGKTVEALRGIERWGAKSMVDAAFQGFAALPARTSGDAWWYVLGVDPDATLADVRRQWRVLVKEHHPDVGGDPETWHTIQLAYEQAMQGAAS